MASPFADPSRQLRSLVVEDDFVNRNLLQHLLTRVGRVDTAANGQEAIQAVHDALGSGDPYRLICLDIMMPGIDGREVLRQLRHAEAEQGIPLGQGAKVLMVSALNDPKTIMGVFKDHCDGYLVKPYGQKALGAELVRLGLI